MDSVVYVKVLTDKEGKEVDLLSAVSTSKSRSYSFELTPEEENVEVHMYMYIELLYIARKFGGVKFWQIEVHSSNF